MEALENVYAGWRRKLMKYIADTVDFELEEPTVVTLGKFDGRHRGHQKLLRTMEEVKESLGYATAIFTFSTAPLTLVTGETATVITTSEERRHNMEKMGISLVKKDYFRASHDSVFFMLRDMAEQRFEQNILLPFVVEFETTCSDTDKYDFYFEELSPEIFFDEVDFDGEIHLVICADFNVEAVGFIYAMARHYRDTTSSHVKQLKDAEDELRNFLISERDYKIEEKVDLTEYRDDSKLYSLLKATWIGDYLTVMANLREMLEHRRRKEEQDLFELLDE